MGLFGRNIKQAYGPDASATVLPSGILSPWGPGDPLVTWAIDDALKSELEKAKGQAILTKETALRIPAVKRAHGIVCSMFARIPFYVMNADVRATNQPEWLTTSACGVSPYHRMWGLASDWFFYGWAGLGFTEGKGDAIHIPYGVWKYDRADGSITIDTSKVPAAYTAEFVLIPSGENGLLIDGADTIAQAQLIEKAYANRLKNPIPLTVLTIPDDVWNGLTRDERREFREDWDEGRRDGGTATMPASYGVNIPGVQTIDLFESGRNAVRLDLANHTGMPAGILEALKQGGGGGNEMHYTSSVGGAQRSELWDFGLPGRFVHAFEGRMSLDDVVPSGLSIRADLSAEFAAPNPNTNPTSED